MRLFDDRLAQVIADIESNRFAAARAFIGAWPSNEQAGKLNRLNDEWAQLEEERCRLTGTTLAPYRMRA